MKKHKADFVYQRVYRYLLRLTDELQGESSAKLPSLRQMARRLRVSISTIQSAYTLLEKEGRIRSIPKSGYFMLPLGNGSIPCEGDLLDRFCANARRPGVCLLGGDNPTLLLSLEGQQLVLERELLRQYPQPSDPRVQPFGDIELRTAIAARYTRSTHSCWHADDVYIGPDLQAILKIVLETLDLRGRTVLIESPCHWTQLRLLQSFDIRVVELPTGDNGLDFQRLDHLLGREEVALALLPSWLNDARGSALSPAERRELADRLNRQHIWVLENDSHGELGFGAPAERLRDWIDPRRLLVFGSFDKMIGPEASCGYLLCKQVSPQWQRSFVLRSFCLPPIRQKAIARLCSSGQLDDHLIGLRQVLAARMQGLAALLREHVGDALRFEVPHGGTAIWAESTQAVDLVQVVDRLFAQRIVLAPGEIFSLQGAFRQNLRISYAIDWDQDISAVLDALNEALHRARLPQGDTGRH